MNNLLNETHPSLPSKDPKIILKWSNFLEYYIFKTAHLFLKYAFMIL
jgi:hypothetical protein